MHERDVVVTGYGLLSSLGEGKEAHLTALNSLTPHLDVTNFAPYCVHSLQNVEFEKQIPRKDQRQMEQWQKIGVYAAGLALEMAGVKGNNELLSTMHMIVAAGGGERDLAVDSLILNGMITAENKGVYLNEKLSTELRPTLFLAQLSNLLAGNISIVHGVTGSSRTFMGEEQAGVDAVRIAFERIRANQGDIFLVGGAYNAERLDIISYYVMGQTLHRGDYEGFSRNGMILGSVSAFLVCESRESAEKRGAKILARLDDFKTAQVNRDIESCEASLSELLQSVTINDNAAIISNMSFENSCAKDEANSLAKLNNPVRHLGLALGHSVEAAFPASVAIAAMALNEGKLFNPLDTSEKPHHGKLEQIVISNVGHYRGESVATISAEAQ
jgi:3-oxoacyl-[acyl-carrier-protein] synthase II